MTIPQIISTVYGVFLLSGAYFGVKVGSKISLVMGLATGAVVLFATYLTYNSPKLGFGILTTTSGILIIVFLMRLIKTGKFMPAGMLLTISIIAFITGVIQLMKS